MKYGKTRAEMTNVPSPWYTGAEMVEWDADFMCKSMLEMIPFHRTTHASLCGISIVTYSMLNIQVYSAKKVKGIMNGSFNLQISNKEHQVTDEK